MASLFAPLDDNCTKVNYDCEVILKMGEISSTENKHNLRSIFIQNFQF